MRKLLPIVLFAAACGTTTHFAATGPSPRPLVARPVAQLFTTGAPAVPYVEVGIIQGRQSSRFSHDELPTILATMARDAGAHGCDALIVNGSNDEVVGERHDRRTLEGFWGSCVVYVSPAADLAVATAPR